MSAYVATTTKNKKHFCLAKFLYSFNTKSGVYINTKMALTDLLTEK